MVVSTALRILRLARDHGPVHAGVVAEDLGVDVSAAYRQLETLSARGLLSSESVASGPGRPKKMYSLTPEGLEAFPRDYALLTNAVLAAVEGRHGRRDLQATLRAIGKGLGEALAHGTVAERVAALERLYNDLGFEARIEKSGPGLVLVQRNCPFLKVARANPDGLCECLDESIVKAALPQANITLKSSLALGHARCQHEIRT